MTHVVVLIGHQKRPVRERLWLRYVAVMLLYMSGLVDLESANPMRWTAFASLILSVTSMAGGLNAAAAVIVPVSHIGGVAQSGGSGDSSVPIMTPSARFVLFASTACNLSPAPNGSILSSTFPVCDNIYVRDRQTGLTTLASADLLGNGGGNGDSFPLGISTNGRFALFISAASNLVVNDTNGVSDIFVRDIENGATLLVTVSTNGLPANGESQAAVMTPDARFVSFFSGASNLVADDTNGVADVFVRDLTAGTTTLASASSPAFSHFISRGFPELSDDGRYVAFRAQTNTFGAPSKSTEILIRDLVLGTTLVGSSGAAAALQTVGGGTDAVSFGQALSADGRYLAFAVNPQTNSFWAIILRYSIESGATEIVHTNALTFAGLREDSREVDITPDGRFIAFLASTNVLSTKMACVLVWDAQTGAIRLASLNKSNQMANGDFGRPKLDPAGRFVAFTSTASDMTTNALLAGNHLYVRDLVAGTTELIDVAPQGLGMGVASFTCPQFSQDARYLAYQGVDPEDRGQPLSNWQILLRDRSLGQTDLISARRSEMPGLTGNAPTTGKPAISQNGRFVAFSSLASDLTATDTNRNRDVFLRDIREGTTILVSANTNGVSANGMSCEPSISSEGRFVAFTSTASDLVPGDTNSKRDVFVFDKLSGTTLLVSRAMTGGSGNKPSFAPLINPAGTAVAFLSQATDLSPGAFTAGTTNLFWRDLGTQTTLAVTTTGTFSYVASTDCRYLVFREAGAGHVWDSFTRIRIYSHGSGIQNPLAVSLDGNRILSHSSPSTSMVLLQRSPFSQIFLPRYSTYGEATFSGDGNYILCASPGALSAADTNQTVDVFLYHVPSKTTNIVSHALNSTQAGNGPSAFPAMSPDARFIAYTSAATNIVAGDTNGVADLFLYDRLSGKNRLLGTALPGRLAAGRTLDARVSGDGRTILFSSQRSDLANGDFNQTPDLLACSLLYIQIEKNGGERPIITWPVLSGLSYKVHSLDGFAGSEWQDLNGDIMITDGIAVMEDPNPDADQRFYQVIGY